MRFSCLVIAVALSAVCVAPASAAVFYQIQRVDDNTVLISGSGSVDSSITSVNNIRFPLASSQIDDAEVRLKGNLGFGGELFVSGGPANTDSIGYAFDSAFDLSPGDGPEGVGGFSTTLFGFTVSPVGTTGTVFALSGETSTEIGSYEIIVVPEPASLGLLGLGGLAMLRRRRRVTN